MHTIGKSSRHPERQRIESSLDFIEATIAQYFAAGGAMRSFVPGLGVARISEPMLPTSYLYEPSLCICVTGSKRVIVGDVEYVYDRNHFLLAAVGLPSIIEMRNVSPLTPYTALQLVLDLDAARQVMAELDANGAGPASGGSAMAVAPLDADLLDSVARLVALLSRPHEAPYLHRLVHREILYRVLTGPIGGQLRDIVRLGSQGQRVSKAIAWLRDNFTQPLRIEQLAETTGMGVSTLHMRFRELTTMSPLQYQKHLRLHEARRLMLSEEVDAATAAFRVGYESPSQFSREYRRLFGDAPMRDVRALREGNVAEAV